jgi:uncharacterized protein (DUF2141 family)
MRKIILACFLLFAVTSLIDGQCRLEIEINGLKSNTGLIMLQLLNENEKVVNQAKGTITDKRSVIVFNDLKPGKYAFQYYHDENLSGKLETGMLGKPKEGYGFSNNASGPFGPKPFQEWLFGIKEDMKVKVTARY